MSVARQADRADTAVARQSRDAHSYVNESNVRLGMGKVTRLKVTFIAIVTFPNVRPGKIVSNYNL